MAKPFQLTVMLSSTFLIIFSKAMSCPSNCRCKTPTAVDCKGTDITIFPTGIPTDTEILRIHATNLTQIPANAFANMANLKDIALLNNQLLTTLPVGLFDGLLKLKKIHISYNGQMTTIPDNFFKNLPNLETIQLKKNGIKNLPGRTFRNLPKLNFLDLEKNQIRSLPGKLFDSTVPNIISLHLNDNQLSGLPDDFFNSLSKSLLYLLLGNNQFKIMPVKALQIMEKLEEISVLGNPLFCNCSLQDFVDWANKSKSLRFAITVFCGSKEIKLLALNLGNCGPSEKVVPKTVSTPTLITAEVLNSTTKTLDLPTHLVETTPPVSAPPKTQPPDNGNTESQDTLEDNEKRKTIILAVSVSLVVCVIVIAFVFCLFHTGILSTRRFKLQKNDMIMYDAEGNILVKDGEVVT